MKKILTVLFVSTLFLSACQWPWAEEKQPVETTQQNVQQITTPQQPTEMITFSDPVEWPALETIQKKKAAYIQKLTKENNAAPTDEVLTDYIARLADSSRLWKTGTFTDGLYKGQSLISGKVGCGYNEPCNPLVVRFAVNETTNEWTLLTPYSSTDWCPTCAAENTPLSLEFFFDVQDNTITIPELDIPNLLKIYQKTDVILEDRAATTVMDFDNWEGEKITLTDPAFKAYFQPDGCIYGIMADGIAARYAVVPKEFLRTTTEKYTLGDTPFSTEKDLHFTDNTGTESVNTYSIETGGCGIGANGCFPMIDVSSEKKEEAALKKIGTLGASEPLEAFMFDAIDENPTPEEPLMMTIKSRYEGYIMKRQYDETLKSEPEMTLNEFIHSNKIFVVKLENGMYTLISTPDFSPQTECGKPVIYLYPTETTTVNVKVGVDTITKSEPIYGTNGWTVTASPDGTLVNSSDHQTYPYLFWEGQSSKTLSTGTGWTVAKKDVATVLPKTLQEMGLNTKETADFMAFWGPRITAEKSPYIEFNFVPQKTFDQIAPLTVTPKPDTVLRIFMTYRGVQTAGLPVPHYTPIQRNGFTLIEWGGALQ